MIFLIKKIIFYTVTSMACHALIMLLQVTHFSSKNAAIIFFFTANILFHKFFIYLFLFFFLFLFSLSCHFHPLFYCFLSQFLHDTITWYTLKHFCFIVIEPKTFVSNKKKNKNDLYKHQNTYLFIYLFLYGYHFYILLRENST